MSINSADQPYVRDMLQVDVSAVMAVETASYEFPWTEGIFRDCLKSGYFGVICELDGRLLGYGMASVGADEAHLLNLCVANEFRNQGIATLLLDKLMEGVVALGAERMFLEVRSSNLAAINLYLYRGFEEIGLRPNYYPLNIGREDAIVLSLDL